MKKLVKILVVILLIGVMIFGVINVNVMFLKD